MRGLLRVGPRQPRLDGRPARRVRGAAVQRARDLLRLRRRHGGRQARCRGERHGGLGGSLKPGFSLIELVIALSLASLVLVGVGVIAAQTARGQAEGVRSGAVVRGAVMSYAAMSKEIEGANVLAYPSADGAGADALIVCKNWSRALGAPSGGKLDAAAGASVVQYCVDAADPANLLLRRYADVGDGVICPNPGVPAPCTASPEGEWTETGVVGFRLEKLAGAPNVFTREDRIGGVRVRYAVGRQAASADDPRPKSAPFDFSIVMQKQCGGALD
ncbi:MAG: prepilin-type N-terminal cleavage/methylation domain-containing protein [Elusimicrobia bacterium]|nr:prepilin-type N-terminal cleavage/methylation domain-containing protein [Elusimicrobiota bacterium]